MNEEHKPLTAKESHMSLGEALEVLHSVRDMCKKCDLDKAVTAFDTVFKWVDDMVSFFYRIGK